MFRRCYAFGTTCRWVINDRIFIPFILFCVHSSVNDSILQPNDMYRQPHLGNIHVVCSELVVDSSPYPDQMVDQHLEMSSTSLYVSRDQDNWTCPYWSPVKTLSHRQPSGRDHRNHVSPLHNPTLLQPRFKLPEENDTISPHTYCKADD